jgi:hypothetical protein
LGIVKSIFKKNAIIALSYTVFFVAISLLFGKLGRSLILGFVYSFVAIIHFMATGILMAVYHFQLSIEKRNGYMASFGFIWLLVLIVQVVNFYF